MASTGALVFGIINIVGNFGAVFTDQAYWHGAIATRPKSAINGFLIGGFSTVCNSFYTGNHPRFGKIGNRHATLTRRDWQWLVTPYAGSQLVGDIGAIYLITMLLTAVTSAGSAELVAVSSILTYHIYRTYTELIKGHQLVAAS